MEIKPIEQKAYVLMKEAFDSFYMEMEELCGDATIEREWLDNQDVCKLLNIGTRTLQHYRDYGTIPFSTIGGKCYYKVSDVEKVIANSKIK